jgi:hypothetical protein
MWGINMKYTIENTNIFDYKLKSKISSAILGELSHIDKNFMYSINVIFNNMALNDIRVDEFVIPQEKLPQYLRGKELNHKDKIYEILSYQIKLAEEIFEEHDVQIAGAGIIGRRLDSMDMINIEILKNKEAIKKITKRNRPMKVVSIMPNEEFTMDTIAKFMINHMQQMRVTLSKAVGGSKILDKILKAISIYDVNKVYKEFEEQYGEYWVESKEYGKELQKKFLERIKVDTGEITVPEEIESAKQKIVLKNKVLYEIPIYSMQQEEFEKRWKKIREKEKSEFISNVHSQEDAKQTFRNIHFPKDVWKYNQIIGYICISINSNDILFDIYKTLDKNFHVNSKTRYFMQNIGLDGYHFRVEAKDSNKVIKNRITKLLIYLEKQYIQEGYYVNMEVYNNTIEHMNIRGLFT